MCLFLIDVATTWILFVCYQAILHNFVRHENVVHIFLTTTHSHTVTQITSTMIKMVVACEFQRFKLTNDTKFTFIAEFVIKTLDLVHFWYDLRLKNIRTGRWTNPIISHNMNWSVAYRLLIIDKDNHRMTNSCIWAIVCDVLCGFCLIQDLSTDLNWILKNKNLASTLLLFHIARDSTDIDCLCYRFITKPFHLFKAYVYRSQRYFCAHAFTTKMWTSLIVLMKLLSCLWIDYDQFPGQMKLGANNEDNK